MRELAVYYCRKCGYYAYYQLGRNAVCPRDNGPLTRLGLPLTKFMDLSCKNRDRLISREIIKANPFLGDMGGTVGEFRCHEAVKRMNARIKELESENEKLKDTSKWMSRTLDELHAVTDGNGQASSSE